MEKIRRKIRLFWTENGKLLLQVVGIIVLIICAIQGANQYVIKNNKSEAQEKQVLEEKKIINKENQKCIEEFIEYCNDGKIEEAYNMLSEECKTSKYPTINSFKEGYVNKIFKSQKDYEIKENEKDYKITFLHDILEVGSSSNRNFIDDYYKVQEDVLGEKKININLYNNI